VRRRATVIELIALDRGDRRDAEEHEAKRQRRAYQRDARHRAPFGAGSARL
jgi:hypothetical protein